MIKRKFGALAAVAVMALAACSNSGSSGSPAASAGGSAAAGGSGGAGCTVGVSWNNFQQPRWAAHDKPAIQKTVEAGGGTYIDADANLDNEQQLTDIDTLISKGAKVLIMLAQDTKADPSGRRQGEGTPVSRSSPMTASSRTRARCTSPSTTSSSARPRRTRSSRRSRRATTSSSRATRATRMPRPSCPQGWDQAGLKDEVTSGRHQDPRPG